MPDVVIVHKNADVRADLASFRHDAVAKADMVRPEQRQGVADSRRRPVEHDRTFAAREVRQEAGDVNDHGLAVFTQTTGGSASSIDVQDAPASFDPNNLPLRVPT